MINSISCRVSNNHYLNVFQLCRYSLAVEDVLELVSQQTTEMTSDDIIRGPYCETIHLTEKIDNLS